MFRDAVVEALGKGNHLLEIGARENVFERGAHSGERKCIAGQSSSNAANIAIFEMDARGNALCDFFGTAVRSAGNAAADGLAKDEHVGIEFPFCGAAARSRANGVGFVRNQERAVTAAELQRGLPVSFVR